MRAQATALSAAGWSPIPAHVCRGFERQMSVRNLLRGLAPQWGQASAAIGVVFPQLGQSLVVLPSFSAARTIQTPTAITGRRPPSIPAMTPTTAVSAPQKTALASRLLARSAAA